MTVISFVILSLGNVFKGLERGQEELKIKERIETIQNIVKIGQNTEKSPGDLRTIAVTQIPGENYQLTLV